MFNVLFEPIHTAKKITGVLVVATKEFGHEVNAEKTKYIFMLRDQNAEQNHNIKTDNKAFEKAEIFQILDSNPKK
jgi:hypothetical protein